MLVVTRLGFPQAADGCQTALQTVVRRMAAHGHHIVSVSVCAHATFPGETYEAYITSRIPDTDVRESGYVAGRGR